VAAYRWQRGEQIRIKLELGGPGEDFESQIFRLQCPFCLLVCRAALMSSAIDVAPPVSP
jgi:hypothetical protein